MYVARRRLSSSLDTHSKTTGIADSRNVDAHMPLKDGSTLRESTTACKFLGYEMLTATGCIEQVKLICQIS